MIIRKAVPADLEEIIDIGVEFGFKSSAVHEMLVSPNKIREAARAAIVDPNAVMLVLTGDTGVQGVVFGIVISSFFSDDVLLQELVLYSRKAAGVFSLIDAFEAEAKARGVCKIIMGAKPNYCNLGKRYLRRGYRLLEEHYIREV